MSPWWLLAPGLPLLAASVLYWLLRRARKGKVQADADRDLALGKLDDKDRLISRKDEVIRVLRSAVADAQRALADVARDHPELARRYLRDVMRRVAEAGRSAGAGVPGSPAPAVPGSGAAGDG